MSTFGTYLYLDEWVGRGDDAGAERQASDVAEVLGAVAKLDGERHTLMTLRGPDEYPELWVAGGNSGRYLVTHSADGEGWDVLVDEHANGGGSLEVMGGGQMGEYDRRWVVTKDVAADAAAHFARHHRALPSGRWESPDE